MPRDERESRRGPFGWRPSLPDPRNIVADATDIPILAKVDPRGTYMPGIYGQGRLSSCTANVVAAAIDADRLVDGRPAMSPSRLAIYWFERFLEGQSPTADKGATGRDSFKAASRFGVLPEADWAYTDDAKDAHVAVDRRTSAKWDGDHWLREDSYNAVRRPLTDFKRVLSNKRSVLLDPGFSGDFCMIYRPLSQ